MPEHHFPRQARVRLRREFERIQREGLRVHAAPFVILALDVGLEKARLGMAVGRKVGNAVVRNRIRRMIRESFRTIAVELPAIDLVIIAKPEASELAPRGREELAAKLIPALRRAAERAQRERKRS